MTDLDALQIAKYALEWRIEVIDETADLYETRIWKKELKKALGKINQMIQKNRQTGADRRVSIRRKAPIENRKS